MYLVNVCGVPVQPRSMDPSKDLAAYGYGSVAWKERVENWKQRQERMHQTRNDGGGDDGDDADLPLYDPQNLFSPC
jgi:cellulose synthase A